MRIALISDHASPLVQPGGTDAGGQNVYVAHVAQRLSGLGHDVQVFTRRETPDVAPVVALRPNLRVVHVDAGPALPVPKEQLLPFMPQFAAEVIRSMRAAPPDIVHANFFMSGWVAQRIRERLDVPWVITFHALGHVRRLHQGLADTFPDERLAIESALVQAAPAVVAECPQDRLDLVRHYGADPARIRVVPCGVDPAEFAPVDRRAARAAMGLRDDEFVVLQLGRLVPRKGVDDVVRAVGVLRQRHGIEARLVVVGGDDETPDPQRTPELARLAAIAREAGVADRVTFAGRRPRACLPTCYGAADVFVTAPWYEPFGITPLEAMACGTPVVGTAVGGIAWSVVDGVTGHLVPPRDTDALAARLARLARNPALARAMGRAGIRRVRSRFTWQRVVDDLVALYRDVSGLPAPARARTAARPLSLMENLRP